MAKSKSSDSQSSDPKSSDPKQYRAKLGGRYPFASIAVPGCDPSVVIPRSGAVVSAEAKAAFEKAAKDDAFPVSKDDVVFTEL